MMVEMMNEQNSSIMDYDHVYSFIIFTTCVSDWQSETAKFLVPQIYTIDLKLKFDIILIAFGN